MWNSSSKTSSLNLLISSQFNALGSTFSSDSKLFQPILCVYRDCFRKSFSWTTETARIRQTWVYFNRKPNYSCWSALIKINAFHFGFSKLNWRRYKFNFRSNLNKKKLSGEQKLLFPPWSTMKSFAGIFPLNEKLSSLFTFFSSKFSIHDNADMNAAHLPLRLPVCCCLQH